jgi:penicillin-binding protein 1A
MSSHPPDPGPDGRPETAGAGAAKPPAESPDEPARKPAAAPAPSAQAKVRPRRRFGRVLRWARRLGIAAAAAMLCAILGVVLVLRHYETGLPSVEELKHYRPPQVTRVLARDGTLLAELFIERRTVVPIDRVPQVMKQAVLAAEDARFYDHAGLDYWGMLRALYVNVRTGSTRQGGSTITQQVVKNVLLTPEKTFERKVRELLLARRLEQELSKDEILELYLNHINFGHGRYGVEEAARYYFGKGIGDVTLSEAAMLAGLPKSPSHYSPRLNPDRARQRRDQVLDRLLDEGFISGEQADQAKRLPIVLAPEVDALSALAPEVEEEVRRTLHDIAGPDAARGGFTVTTTIDPELQAAARAALRKTLDDYADRHGWLGPIAPKKPSRHHTASPAPFQGVPKAEGHPVYWAVAMGGDDARGELDVRVGTVDGVVRMAGAKRYNPKALPPSRFAEHGTLVRVSPVLDQGLGPDGVPREYRLELGPESALVAIDVATRQILALAGSYEAVRGGLDRASHAHRQPGSAFKPMVYSYGIHTRRLTAASEIGVPTGATPFLPDGAPPRPGLGGPDAGLLDGGTPALGPNGPPPLRVREALAKSVNPAAVWALRELGPQALVAWAHAVGIHSKLGADESLALGAYEVSPRELGGAYSTFAAGGTSADPVLITSIIGPDGTALELPSLPAPRRVMDPAEAYVVTSLLTSVVQQGTGKRAKSLDRPIAGKTGTSNDSRDGWFAGYSTDLVCVVWTGYDDAVSLGASESGASAALPAFVDFMRVAHRKRPAREFVMPDGIVRVTIDPRTGLLAYPGQSDGVEEIFLAGTEPTAQAEPLDGGLDAGADAEAALEGGVAPGEPATGEGAGPPAEASHGKGGGAPSGPKPTAVPRDPD